MQKQHWHYLPKQAILASRLFMHSVIVVRFQFRSRAVDAYFLTLLLLLPSGQKRQQSRRLIV